MFEVMHYWFKTHACLGQLTATMHIRREIAQEYVMKMVVNTKEAETAKKDEVSKMPDKLKQLSKWLVLMKLVAALLSCRKEVDVFPSTM